MTKQTAVVVTGTDKSSLSLDPKDDGKTHINIYSMGKTHCGRTLSPFAYHRFTHPEFGDFSGLEGLYYYISTGCNDDRFRRLHGVGAKRAGKKLLKIKRDDFEEQMRQGIWACYMQSPRVGDAIMDQLISNDCKLLPFVHYYNYSGKVVAPQGNLWLVEEWEKVRDHVIVAMGGEVVTRENGVREVQFLEY